MRNMRLSRQLFSVVAMLVCGFAAVLYFQIRTSSESIIDQRYDMQRIQTESAISILKMYYEREQKGEMSRQAAQAAALDTLSAVRYNPDGYLFAYDYDGNRLAYPDKKGVGTNQIAVKDKNGVALIAELIKAARNGGGFVKYHWTRLNMPPENTYPKVGYALAFEPWKMMVGTGAYLDDLENYIQADNNKTIAAAIAVLIATLIVAYTVIRSMTGALGDLRAALLNVANENTDFEVPHTTRANEIGAMAKATQVLQEKVRERHAMAARQEEQQRELDEERQRNLARQQEEAAQQAKVVSTIGAALSRLAEGDLAVRCGDLGGAYAQLRSNFNDALSRLEEALLRVRRKSQEIGVSKDEIRRASRELASRTEHQAANLEETSAALDELTVAIRQTADGAREAANRVQTVSHEAQQSDSVVNRAIEAMSGIEKSSEEITKIIGVIDEIAFQTNLLALNAGVEAARAGESGKGFAVVAQEVRELAQRSAAAAKEIKEQIARSSDQVHQGVQLVGETGEALRRISQQISQANEVVARIAASAQEQDTTLRSISSSLNQLDTATQQNAAMAQETTGSAEVLDNDAGELLHLIEEFRLSASAPQAQPVALRMAS
ncbi:methyl-accepting chemotaxis protein [Rhizobium paknamense]|uniref:Methyl-accepting chemotaxis protein n=1 Tax=Rhizobium paknamense TaxID=1206817 RepID=A0ABU0IIT5_9HYPH|nr:methyl-accepting chemotaxis protein [Rhizobium paknamense]MDQ0458173.1 methyl-accepting chemotaxis protein [Rhizobium paknamense]